MGSPTKQPQGGTVAATVVTRSLGAVRRGDIEGEHGGSEWLLLDRTKKDLRTVGKSKPKEQ